MSKRKKRRSWLSRQLSRRPRPLWVLIVCDAALLGAALVVFALFHHVLPRHEQSVGIVSSRNVVRVEAPAVTATQAPAADATAEAPAAPATQAAPEQTPTPEPTEDPNTPKKSVHSNERVGWFGDRFPDKFTDGEVIKSDSGYQSANLNITLTRYSENRVVYYVADIYIKDIICLKSVFAKDTFGKGMRDWVTNMSQSAGGIIAINGDFYGARSGGVVMRNGELYRNDARPRWDLCALYWDGSMETYSPSDFDIETAVAEGACQIWNFGPKLLDDNGGAMTQFNSTLTPANPRTALGYYEPGHYCFVVVEGRSRRSRGMKLTELSELMHKLGCARAYNLDGGDTSVLVVGDKRVSTPSGTGRKSSDAIVIVDL